MRSVHESNVTAAASFDAPGMGRPDPEAARSAGVWTLAGDELILAEPGGPATLLVPTESVLLLGVDLPLASRAKRLQALPFALEDRIADSIDAVHLALGAEIAPKRYLVAVIRHEQMAAWVDRADAFGLGHAAMVPDALALPVPPEGHWSVDLSGGRAVVRAGDGTGFACPAGLLRPAWDAAGKPPAIAYGEPLPADMLMAGAALEAETLAARLAAPAVDLRQGLYARRASASGTSLWRRLVWLLLIAAFAHTIIGLGDALMLRVIADRREAEFRQLAALAAPGVQIGDDPANALADVLPRGGGGAGVSPQSFVPLLNRVSSALAPMATKVNVRTLAYQGNTLTLDLDQAEPGLAAQIGAALRNAQVQGAATESPGGNVRVTASIA